MHKNRKIKGLIFPTQKPKFKDKFFSAADEGKNIICMCTCEKREKASKS